MCAGFDIDGAAVYTGDDMHRSISVGKYVNPIQNLTWAMDKKYQELFDEQGVYMESTMSRLKDSYKEAGRMYVSQENGNSYSSWLFGKADQQQLWHLTSSTDLQSLAEQIQV